MPIIDRSAVYAVAYPFTESFNIYFVAVLTVVLATATAWLISRWNETSFVIAAACWAIILGTGLFITNRPGIGDYYLTFGHKGGPDQFFFAQNMVFIFALGWLCKEWVKRWTVKIWSFGAVGLLLYLLVALPFGTSYGDSAVVYRPMRDIEFNLGKACRAYAGEPQVIVQIYPTSYWQWHVDHDLACED
jgi:hypothetical protein